MAKRCEICGKDPASGNKVSHSNIKTRRRWLPNLQRAKILTSSGPRRVQVCTRCLRSGKVQRAV